ncbi:MAG: transglutaminase-like domain-containing protein [candidate division WOR-3 bacterium]
MRNWLIAFWVLTLLCYCGQPAKPGSVVPKPEPDAGEVWLATYLAGMKIGYGLVKYQRIDAGFSFDNVNRMTVKMIGKQQTVNTRSQVITGPDLSLRSFKFELVSEGGVFRAAGQVDNNRLMLKTDQGTKTIQLTRKLYPLEALGRVVVNANPGAGERLNYLTFDPTVLDTFSTEVEVFGQETLRFGNEVLPALKLKVRRAQLDMDVWVDELGMTLKETSGLGMSSIRVSMEQALAGEAGPPLDIIKTFAVRVDTVIPAGRRYHRALLQVTGIDSAVFKIGDGIQRVTGAGDGIRVEVVIPEPRTGVKLPVTDQPELLKPTLTIQSTDPEIVRVAREIVGGTDDAVVAAERIVQWVNRSLKKEAVASLPSAVEVLKRRKGDCNEHSVLVAALSRAAGIPAQVVVGLAYLDGAFYYHAWNEVYLGNWVPVDATFGEFPAGALRLKLAAGELSQQAEVLGVVSRIGIRVLEFE